MGASKLHIYTDEIIDIAEISKVFGHPARVAILSYISKQKDCINSDLVDEIGLSQPTISQHLQVIKKSGLLKGTYKGTNICYCLNVERFEQYQQLLNQFFNATKFNCC